MNRVKIDEKRDLLIVEKHKDGTILKGSKIFCGCCGEQFGILKKNMTFPFKYNEFVLALKNKSFEEGAFGTRHNTCRHTMPFKYKDSVPFVPVSAYKNNS